MKFSYLLYGIFFTKCSCDFEVSRDLIMQMRMYNGNLNETYL